MGSAQVLQGTLAACSFSLPPLIGHAAFFFFILFFQIEGNTSCALPNKPVLLQIVFFLQGEQLILVRERKSLMCSLSFGNVWVIIAHNNAIPDVETSPVLILPRR